MAAAAAAAHMSPHSARAVGLAPRGEEDAGAATAEKKLVPEPEPDPEPEPEPEAPPSWSFYLPTKFEEGSWAEVEFPAYGWQNQLHKVAVPLGMVPLDVKNKEKTGQERVVCCIMQPYHLFREYYVGRMLNRSCWTTKFFGFPDLCEKVKMKRYLSSLGLLLGADCPLLHTAPKTFVLPDEWELLEGFMNAGIPRTVIVKPEGGSQGKGIFITQTLEDIPRAGKAAVVQNYIADPLLLGGLKFDLRVYVVVVGLGAQQRIVIVQEGLARFCTKQYTQPEGTICESDYSRDALRAHLTNVAANKGSEDYDPNVAKRTLGDVLQQLTEVGLKGELGFEFSEAAFWKELEEIVCGWFICMSPVLGLTFRQAATAARGAALSRRKQSGARAFMAAQRAKNNPDAKPAAAEKPAAAASAAAEGKAAAKTLPEEHLDYLKKNRTAQVCGFDVMMDSAGKLHLLEVNNTPSLSTEEIIPAHGSMDEEELHEGGGCVCTEPGCQYTNAWEEGASHIHREGVIDVAIKAEVVTSLLSLITESHELYTGGSGSVGTSAAGREVNIGGIAEPAAAHTMSLLQAAYVNSGFLDTDDLGDAGWASSALLAFSQPVQFSMPERFRNALLSLCTAGAEADLEAMVSQWNERMHHWYEKEERRSSSARLEVGELVRFLHEAIGKGTLRVDLGGMSGVLRELAAFADPA